MSNEMVTRRGFARRASVGVGAAVGTGVGAVAPADTDDVKRGSADGVSVGEYRKINPTEGELEVGLTPGPLDPPVLKEFELETSSQMLARNTSLQNARRPASGAS